MDKDCKTPDAMMADIAVLDSRMGEIDYCISQMGSNIYDVRSKIDLLDSRVCDMAQSYYSDGFRFQVLEVLRGLGILDETYTYTPASGIALSEESFMRFVEGGAK